MSDELAMDRIPEDLIVAYSWYVMGITAGRMMLLSFHSGRPALGVRR